MRISRILALSLVVCVLGAACQAAATGTAGPVVVHRSDAGSTVSVPLGQHLILSLGAPLPSDESQAWTLALYPKQALKLLFRSAPRGRFEFEAVAEGSGKILALTHLRGARCGPPAALSPQCLQSGQTQTGSVPPRPYSFVVFIRVLP